MKRKTERQKQRAKEGRRENPDKVAAQQERKRLRAKGPLAPYVPPPPKSIEQQKAEQSERMRQYHARRVDLLKNNKEYSTRRREMARERDKIRYAKLKEDPQAHAEFLAKKRERNRRLRRLKRGIPEDTPLYFHRISTEEKARRAAEKEARKAERAAKQAAKPSKPVKPKISEEQRREQRLAKRREYNRRQYEADRLKRAAKLIPPAVCPDPPELQALFKKAAKGEPVRPIVHNAKKRSVFHLRGYY